VNSLLQRHPRRDCIHFPPSFPDQVDDYVISLTMSNKNRASISGSISEKETKKAVQAFSTTSCLPPFLLFFCLSVFNYSVAKI